MVIDVSNQASVAVHLLSKLERIHANTVQQPDVLIADAAYCSTANLEVRQERGLTPTSPRACSSTVTAPGSRGGPGTQRPRCPRPNGSEVSIQRRSGHLRPAQDDRRARVRADRERLRPRSILIDRADSKFFYLVSAGLMPTQLSIRLMSCAIAIRPARTERNPLQRSRIRANLLCRANTCIPFRWA